MVFDKKSWEFDDVVTEDDANRWEIGIDEAHKTIGEHAGNKENPHGVTKNQVGLGNVDNVKQETPSGAQEKANEVKNWVKDYSIGTFLQHIDPNVVNKTGFYVFTENTPTSDGAYYGYHLERSIDWAAQFVMRGGTDKAFFRTKNLGKWQEWHEVVQKDWLSSFGIKDDEGLYVSDLNNINKSGFYTADENTANVPENTFTQVFSSMRNNSAGSQLAICRYSRAESRFFFRSQWSGTWTNWEEIATKEQLELVASHARHKGNPHNVTKSQIGLGNVDNYGTSTQSQAETGSHNHSFMTPLRTKQAIDKLAPTPSKADIGLGDVDNIKQASKVEFDSHVNNTSNPHDVTKEQVGLSNVDNVKQVKKSGDTMDGDLGVDGNVRTKELVINHPNNEDDPRFKFVYNTNGDLEIWANADGTWEQRAVLGHRYNNGVFTIGGKDVETIEGSLDKVNNIMDWIKDYGIGANALSANFDTVNKTGFYGFTDGKKPFSTGMAFYGYHLERTSEYASQFAITSDGYRAFYRGKTTSGWREWKEIVTKEQLEEIANNLNSHIGSQNNPHNVTKSQIGLGNVDNVKQETPSGAQKKANEVKNWVKDYSIGTFLQHIDPNVVNKTGFYVFTENTPTSDGAYYGYHLERSIDWAAQFVMRGGTDKAFFRTKNLGKWQQWHEIVTKEGLQEIEYELEEANTIINGGLKLSDGIFEGGLEPSFSTANYIGLSSGNAIIGGLPYYYEENNTSHDVSGVRDGKMYRYVVQLDLKTGNIKVVKKEEHGKYPPLIRNTEVYELSIATVEPDPDPYMAYKITDTRQDKTICGFVKPLNKDLPVAPQE
ncbi:pyocin knob domain-containing protein [Virgibacillus sp. Bac330]|uniref:pyocin knob domain-containing protein n=1 Tax=Virgibacillus sp. Bac330 TaxID=2419841 RepID=UPI001F09F2DD|nr:pyocin knob domain-containing protein [Virgibacillus sp. Bac330]